MTNAHFNWSALLMKYLQGNIQPEELQELNRQKATNPDKQQEFDRLMDPHAFREDMHLTAHIDHQATWNQLIKAHPELKRRHHRMDPERIKIPQTIYLAIIIILGLAVITFFWCWFLLAA